MCIFKTALLTFVIALPALAKTQTSAGLRYTCQSEWSFERLEMMGPTQTATGQYSLKLTDITSSQDVILSLKGTVEADKFDVVASEESLFSHANGTRLTGKKDANSEWTVIWSIGQASNGASRIRLLCD